MMLGRVAPAQARCDAATSDATSSDLNSSDEASDATGSSVQTPQAVGTKRKTSYNMQKVDERGEPSSTRRL
jgi:hypothetical protein